MGVLRGCSGTTAAYYSNIEPKRAEYEITIHNYEQSMDKLQAMAIFARVVETGGVTRAADSLGVPKATATTLIQKLEATLGVRLLNRTTRRVSVTPDGAAYYDRCLAI